MNGYLCQTVRVLALIVILACMQSQTSLAQDETVLPLTLNETFMGELEGASASVTYRFAVPPGHDIVVAYEADKVVMSGHCVTVTTASVPETACTGGGGGSGDPPVSRMEFIPGTDQVEAKQTVELELFRPFEGKASYQLTVMAIPPQTLTFPLDVRPSQSYQVYTLTADLEQPFTVLLEARIAPVGVDIEPWAVNLTYEPYLPYFTELITLSEQPQLIPQQVDYDNRVDNGQTKTFAHLYYLGGDTFRVVVEAEERYSIAGAEVVINPLDEATEQVVTLSSSMPIQVVRLNTNGTTGTVNLHFELVEGTEIHGTVYSASDRYGGYLILGGKYPVAYTKDAAVDRTNPVIVVIRGDSKDEATVRLRWELQR